MIVNKYISSREIIEDVYRNTGSSEELPWVDLIYFVFEALELMNQPLQYLKKVTGHKANPNLKITNYKAKLPQGIHKVIQIAVNGLPARYTTNTFHQLLDGKCCGLDANSTTQDVFIDNFGFAFSPQSSAFSSTGNVYDVITFDINNDYITLSVKEGEVCIAYEALPVDDEGFPSIPDDMSYRVSIRNYLMMKLAYINWIKDPTNSGKKAIFDHSEREWCWYVGQATRKAKIPNIEEMESLKNQILKLIPNPNFHDSFFRNLGAKENRKVK